MKNSKKEILPFERVTSKRNQNDIEETTIKMMKKVMRIMMKKKNMNSQTNQRMARSKSTVSLE